MDFRKFLQKIVLALGVALCWIMFVFNSYDIANYIIGGTFILEALLTIGEKDAIGPILIFGVIGVAIVGLDIFIDSEENGAVIAALFQSILPIVTIVLTFMQIGIIKHLKERVGGKPFEILCIVFPIVMCLGSVAMIVPNFIKGGAAIVSVIGSIIAMLGALAWVVFVIWGRILYKGSYSSSRRRSSSSTNTGRKPNVRLKTPTLSIVKNAALNAAINNYMNIVSVSGGSGSFTVRVSGAGNGRSTQFFMDDLAKQLSEYDVSGISVYFS